MDSLTYLSVIIPAYNEEQRLEKTLESILDYLKQKNFSWELLVVLDGCTDKTFDKIAAILKSNRQIRIINRKENRGKGYTVREGMLAAQGQIRLFTDADNSTDLSHFDLMKKLFDKGFPVVIASRNNKDASGACETVAQPLIKRILGTLGNLAIQFLAVPGIWDTQCGFKAFSAEAAQAIFSKAEILGWGFDIEALALARKFGYKTGIIPAKWIDNKETHVTGAAYLRVLLETVKVRWNLLSGVYNR